MGLTQVDGPAQIVPIGTDMFVSGRTRVLLAPMFGLMMGLCLAGAWRLVDRPLTGGTLLASLFLAAAATISAGVALAIAARLRRLPWSARFAAAFVPLAGGTLGLTAFFMMMHMVTAGHDLTEVPVRVLVAIMVINTAAALHHFLSLAGLAMLPFALPVIVAFAALVARDAR